ncbi:MAG: hypothetical protein D4S00_07955 [Streptomycetaceae bacterium]|nr:MAG: hypothetical protein D4S00_07955 [Streptomycetaceae bacterium]
MSKEILAEYSENFNAFMAVARRFDAETAAVVKEVGEWSPAFVMHHVADAEMHFALRYFNALTIVKPPVIPFNEDEYPDVLNYAGRDWLNSLSLIESVGKLVIVALSPISHTQWDRLSVHPEAGEVSVSFLIGKARNHMQAHTEQLQNLL